jgi:hypothetical protein
MKVEIISELTCDPSSMTISKFLHAELKSAKVSGDVISPKKNSIPRILKSILRHSVSISQPIILECSPKNLFHICREPPF